MGNITPIFYFIWVIYYDYTDFDSYFCVESIVVVLS